MTVLAKKTINDDTNDFMNLLSDRKDKGVYAIATRTRKTDKMHNIFMKASELSKLYCNPYSDYWIAPNTLRKWRRRNQDVLQLNAFWVDVDYAKAGYSYEMALEYVYQALDDHGIFKPTAIFNSGHGLYLFWKIEPIIVNSVKVVRAWRQIQSDLATSFSEIGADSSASSESNLIRLVGTNNNKGNQPITSYVEYMDDKLVYEMRDFLIEVSTYNQKPDQLIGHRILFKNEYNLNLTRAKDIIKLAEMRDYDLQGQRHMFLFVYRNFLQMAEINEAEELTIEFNEKLVDPLSLKEVIQIKPRTSYCYRNKTLISLLGISAVEQEELATIISHSERKKRKRRANNRRYEPIKAANAAHKRQRNQLIAGFKAAGKTQREVAKRLSISLRTVQNYWHNEVAAHIQGSIGTISKDAKNSALIL